MLYVEDLLQNMSEKEQSIFKRNWRDCSKSTDTAFALCLILGNVGGHWYYLGNVKKGLIYTAFFWTFIPAIISLIDLFSLKTTVAKINYEIGVQLKAQIRANCSKSA